MSVAPKKRLLNLFMAMSMAAAVSVSAQAPRGARPGRRVRLPPARRPLS
jgi:hypothetical protein